MCVLGNYTVDGRNPANQLRLVVYPIVYKVVHPRWCRISSIKSSNILEVKTTWKKPSRDWGEIDLGIESPDN